MHKRLQRDGAAARRGRLALHGNAHRAFHNAHDAQPRRRHSRHKLVVPHVVLGKRQHVADGGRVQRIPPGRSVRHALVRPRRHAPFLQVQAVQLRLPVFVQHGEHAGRKLGLAVVHKHHVHHTRALRRLDALQRAQRLQIRVGQSLRRLHVNIVPAIFVHVMVGVFEHVRRRGRKPRQKARAQRHDEQDGQVPVQALPNPAQDVFSSRAFQGLTTRSFPRAAARRSRRSRSPCRSSRESRGRRCASARCCA